MMKALVEAQLYRDAGAVKRYHVKRTHRTQTVAEHTFGMLMLLKQVMNPTYPSHGLWRVYEAVMHHDLPELMTGDIPAPIKRVHPELGPLMESIEQELTPLYQEYDLTVEEECLVKWADRTELVMWCLEEYRMGNTYLRPTITRGLGWIMAAHVPACARELTIQLVADAWTLGLAPATGAELEMKA